MRVLIQRVKEARVQIDGKIHGEIGIGLLVFLGIESSDDTSDADWIIQKITNLRIFNDVDDKMNLSIQEINGSFLIVSQFTLHASTKKGNRPSFIKAARAEVAIPIYDYSIEKLKTLNYNVETGSFGADMKVSLINDGPVTIWMDSKNKE